MAAIKAYRSTVTQSIPELAIEARKLAVEDVERLLQHPEDLKRLDALVEDYTAKHQANKAQLSNTVSTQVEAARSGMALLDRAHKSLANMQNSYKMIDELCTECSLLIENHEKIQVLSSVHYNLGKTLQDVENIVALPHEAAEAEDMLKDDSQLLQAYESLAILEGTSSLAQQALQSSAKLKLEDTHNLNAYFNKVKDTMTKFEERLWSLIRNFVELGHNNPAMLVAAVRIVEIQELVDKQLESSGRAAVPAKRYKKRMQQQIGMCIQDITAPLLQRCSQLVAAGQDTDKRTNEILEDAHNFVAQLADIYDYVSPCFPEKYGIFQVIWKQYHEHLAFMLDCVGACAEQLANADILKVMAWVNQYSETLRDLGIEEDKLGFPHESNRGMGMLTDKYIERMRQQLNAWFTNIIQADMNAEPKVADDGTLWTPGAVDFFRIVNAQVNVVEETSKGDMLLKTGQMAVKVMRDFQDAENKELEKGLSVELLCAFVNNNARCYNESMEFAERMEDTLDDDHKVGLAHCQAIAALGICQRHHRLLVQGLLDIEEQCRGFLAVAKAATALLVNSVFADTAFLELFSKLCCSDEWKQGAVTASILATLEDYLGDFKRMLDESFFKRLCETALEETVCHFMAAVLTQTRAITEQGVQTLQSDHDQLVQFFQQNCKPERVVKLSAPLQDLKDVAAADSVDTFVLTYTTLLQVAPGISPALLERIVQARTDLSKADSREVMIECREVFLTKHSSDTADSLPGKGKSATTPFKVALTAVKKRPVGPEQKDAGKSSDKSGGIALGTLGKITGKASDSQKAQEPVMLSFTGMPKLEIIS